MCLFFRFEFSQVPEEHKLALDIITYIGCGLSLVGEALSALAYVVLLYAKNISVIFTFFLENLVFKVIVT